METGATDLATKLVLTRVEYLGIVVGVLAPWLANAVYLLDLGPIPNLDLDLTPFAFSPTGLALPQLRGLPRSVLTQRRTTSAGRGRFEVPGLACGVLPLRIGGYVKTAAMSAGDVGENPLFIMDYAMRLLRVVVLLALWRTMLAGREVVGAMPLATVLTYTVVAEVFGQQLAVTTTLSEAFWDGTLVLRFLRPMGLVRQFAAEMSGRWALHFALFSVPLVLLTPLLGVDPRPASPAAGALFIVSLGLAVVVGLAMEVLFGALTVALEQPVWLIDRARTAIATLLSGSLLPLAFYPWGLGDVFSWLPFAAMAWAPLAIYTGTGQPLPLMASQVVWAVVLWPLADWLWRANREKLVGYGG